MYDYYESHTEQLKIIKFILAALEIFSWKVQCGYGIRLR